MPIVTPRVDAPDRSPNTTPIATNAAAMKGVPITITIAGSKKPQRCAQRELMARVLARLARRQGAGDGEDQKRRRHGDVSPQVDPLETETGDGRPKREADLHR